MLRLATVNEKKAKEKEDVHVYGRPQWTVAKRGDRMYSRALLGSLLNMALVVAKGGSTGQLAGI